MTEVPEPLGGSELPDGAVQGWGERERQGRLFLL